MKNLTPQEREQVALEEMAKQPTKILCTLAAASMGQTCIASGAATTEMEIPIEIENKKYNVKMVVTATEVK